MTYESITTEKEQTAQQHKRLLFLTNKQKTEKGSQVEVKVY